MNGLKTHLNWLTGLALQSQCQESLGGRNIGMHLAYSAVPSCSLKKILEDFKRIETS